MKSFYDIRGFLFYKTPELLIEELNVWYLYKENGEIGDDEIDKLFEKFV